LTSSARCAPWQHSQQRQVVKLCDHELARAHSHRHLLNKAQSTGAPTAAARACPPGRVGLGYLWPDVEWDRRHVAHVWCSDHHKAAESPAATTKERGAAMSGRSLPCRFCSWAHGRRTTRGGSGTRGSDASAPTLVRRTARKRQSSSCSYEQRLPVSPTVIGGGVPRKKSSYLAVDGRHLVKNG